ncbi:hypothetical protein ACNKHV_20385 [Shigella flexneri]
MNNGAPIIQGITIRLCSVTPTSQYLKVLNEGSHQPDDVQKEAVSRLKPLSGNLSEHATSPQDEWANGAVR